MAPSLLNSSDKLNEKAFIAIYLINGVGNSSECLHKYWLKREKVMVKVSKLHRIAIENIKNYYRYFKRICTIKISLTFFINQFIEIKRMARSIETKKDTIF